MASSSSVGEATPPSMVIDVETDPLIGGTFR